MANTSSAKKAIRSSENKRSHNLLWRNRFKTAEKSVVKAIAANESKELLDKKLEALQKALDKAAKEKAIHKNKANRVKSRYAKRIAALLKGEVKPKAKTAKARSKRK